MSNKNDIDWMWVSNLIDAAAQARSMGFIVGTTNWGAHIYRALRDAPQAEPEERTFTDDHAEIILGQGLQNLSHDVKSKLVANAYARFATVARALAARPSAPTAVEPDERAEFEAWYEAYLMPAESDWFRREPEDLDDYIHPMTSRAWAAWQARASKGTPK